MNEKEEKENPAIKEAGLDVKTSPVDEVEEESDRVEDDYPFGLRGPTQREIDKMKKQYGDKLQLVDLANSMWVFRQMSRAEHIKLLDEGNLLDLDSDFIVVQTLLVWPSPDGIDWEKMPAGVVPSLSADMLAFSGFVRTTAPVSL